MKRQISFFLTLVLLLSLTSCGGGPGAAATTMHLKRADGTVGVRDGEGKDLEPRDDLGLYSGYGVDTRAESYAWIDLDSVKLTKLDQDSEIEITKDGKLLEIEVKSGSLFFNVTEPLAEDETMNIRTSTMMVGIRGTCGWVALSGDESVLSVYLLEGKVECSNADSTATVSAGEKGTIPASGEITVAPCAASVVPAFVKAELEDDGALSEEIKDASGIDVLAPADPIRLRDMYACSKTLNYDENGELSQEIEYFPDEQGRLGRSVTHNLKTGSELAFEYIYNDAGALQTQKADNGVVYTVTEDTADHRKKVRGDMDMVYIYYYDEQGRETKQEFFINGELSANTIFTYDAEGRLARADRYSADGTVRGYELFEYD